MKVGDLVKYRDSGVFGVIVQIREGRFNKTTYNLCEVLWVDGHTSDVLPRRLEAVCK